MSDAPLKLYWWNAKPNFGDELSRLVTAHAAGRDVVHAPPKEAEIFALGSIMQFVRRTFRGGGFGVERPVIWGTGMMKAIGPDFVDAVEIAVLRGPITASLLGVQTERFGDPGLLTAEAIGEVPEREERIGLILHHAQLGDARVQDALAREPRLHYIDVQGAADVVCREIATCAHVISSSLHGLIVADSFGIPNTWLDPMDHARMKYYDYAAAIGRALPLPLRHDEIVEMLPSLSQGDLPYADGIAHAKETLMTEFPARLRGGSQR